MATGKKRGLVYGVIGAMLCVAVYLNWSYVQSPDELLVAGQADAELSGASVMQGGADGTDAEQAAGEQAAVTSGSDYFAQSRRAREQARDQASSILKASLQDEKADEKTREDAASQISQLADDSVTEARVESLIKAKGYADAVVFVSEDAVNVIIQPPEAGFAAEDAAVVRDIVMSETGADASQIKIVEAA